MADDRDKKGRPSFGTVVSIAIGATITAVLIAFLLRAIFSDQKNDNSQKGETTIATQSREPPSFFGIADSRESSPFPWCEGVDKEKVVELQDNPEHRITIEMQPCWGVMYSIPSNWTSTDFKWEKGDKVGFWSDEGKMKIAYSEKKNDLRYVGRRFHVAGVGPLHLMAEKVSGEWLTKIFGTTNSTSQAPSITPASSEEPKTSEGTLVQWYPRDQFIILLTKDGETKFRANQDTQITVGLKVYHLGNQGILSGHEPAYPEPGDKYRVHYYESNKFILGMELIENVRDNLPNATNSREPSTRNTEEIAREKVIRGKITEIDEATGKLSIENKDGPWSIVLSEETLVFIEGQECQIESLRVDDFARIYFLEGSETVHRIEVGMSDASTSTRVARKGDPLTGEYWATYFRESKNK